MDIINRVLIMHNQTIFNFRKNPSLSFTQKLRAQYQGSQDLIIYHEWVSDLLSSKLAEDQFNRLISQQAYYYDWLVSRIVGLTLKDPTRHYDELRKIALFLLNESFGDLRLLDNIYIRALKLSLHTKEYIEYLKNIWLKHSYLHKLITIYPVLWIHSDLSARLLSDSNPFIMDKEWVNRIALSSSQDLLDILSHLIDEEAQFITSQEQLELENIVSRVFQFELLIRNESYQTNSTQFYSSKEF